MEEKGTVLQFKRPTVKNTPKSTFDISIPLNPALAPRKWQKMSDIGWEITSESKIELVYEND
jgi:hypothetical protein